MNKHTRFYCDNHSGLELPRATDVVCVMDVHSKIMTNMVRIKCVHFLTLSDKSLVVSVERKL